MAGDSDQTFTIRLVDEGTEGGQIPVPPPPAREPVVPSAPVQQPVPRLQEVEVAKVLNVVATKLSQIPQAPTSTINPIVPPPIQPRVPPANDIRYNPDLDAAFGVQSSITTAKRQADLFMGTAEAV